MGVLMAGGRRDSNGLLGIAGREFTPSRMLPRMAAETLVISDEFMLRHDGGPGHPERPERLAVLLEMLEGRGIAKPQAATRAHIERVHDPRYVARIEALRRRSAQLDPDTAISRDSVQAAYLAAGAAVNMVDALMGGAAKRCFALVRPPGHHAERDRAMGFCLFNNIAIAAAHAIEHHGLERVLIVDWDVHHGNGTQHTFEARRDVLVFNVHQDRLFPDTGDLDEVGMGEGVGFTVNAPLPPGVDDAGYVELFRRVLVPIADAYEPQLVLVSAGFDAHRDDPLGEMMVTEQGFAAMTAIVREIADRHANGRLGLTLEGGYHLGALSNSVAACLRIVDGGLAPPVKAAESQILGVIDQIALAHRHFWPQIPA